MFRKSVLLSIVFVLCALVVVMILLGGCIYGPTPAPTIKPTLVPTLDIACLQEPQTPYLVVVDATVKYIRLYYPEQNLPKIDYFYPPPPYYWRVRPASGNYGNPSGNWILTINRDYSPFQLIVRNQLTGFRWEGDVYWSGGTYIAQCRYSLIEVDRVEERSVTIPTPGPTTALPRASPYPTYGLSTDITPAPTPTR